jgi:hypothetical protein
VSGAVGTRDEYMAAAAKCPLHLAATRIIKHRKALAAHEAIKSEIPISDRYFVKRFRACLKSSLEAWVLRHGAIPSPLPKSVSRHHEREENRAER